MTLDLCTPSVEPQRDRWGRPLIVPPGGGKAVPYMRATTLAGTLEDRYNLGLWQQRMVAIGLSRREDLLLAVAAHSDERDKLNELCERAIEAAKGDAAATIGTALHALTDRLDRGILNPADVPAAYRPDLEAFATATAPLEVTGIECFGVLDDLIIAGTCDRIYRYKGKRFIGDTKSGSVDWGQGKIAIQLALYSRMKLYNVAAGTRGLDLSDHVDQDVGIVVHLPAGTGKAKLLEVDIASAWQYVELAIAVRDWRKLNSWMSPLVVDDPAVHEVDLLSAAIATADCVEALTELWRSNRADWTDLHSELAKARRASLTPART